MSLKRVSYEDQDGRKTYVLLPEEASEEEAAKGILVGPPPLEELGLPLNVEVSLNNELFYRGIITADDMRRRKNEVYAALQAALKVDANSIISLYLGRGYENANKESTEKLTNSPVHYRRPRKPRK